MIQINPIYHDIQLSFGASDVKRTVIKQSSDYTHILRIKLYDKGNDEIIINSGWYISISAVKSDNKYILNSNNISVVNNSIQVTMTKQMLAAPGTEKCELIIQDGNQTLFSDTFLIYVDPNVQDGSFIESSNECGSIIDALDKINGYEKEALETKSHIVSVSNDVDNLKKDIEDTYDELEDAVTQTKDLITENKTIKDNENERNVNESNRITAESARVAEFNKIKNDAQTEITKLQNVNIEAIEGQESYQVKITDKDGNSKTSDNLLNKISIGTVDKGDYNESPSATITGEFGNQKLNLRLPTGNPFVISNTYSSISEMEADKENINLYDFVMINTGNVEDEDNGKLYMKDTNSMMFITDLSGVQGIQGVKGETGLTPNLTIGSVTTGEEGTKASVTITGTAENPIINFVIPKGNTGNAGEISALSLPYNGKDDTKTTKEVIDNALEKISSNTTALDNKVSKIDGMGLSSNDYTTEEKTKLNGLNKQLLDKLGESTDGNLTFNNKEINAAQMIGATANEDGESGTVPQPTAGQENYVLKGDGTWKPEQEIIIDSELSDTSENSVQNKIIKAQIDSLNQAIEDAKALKASLEQYGMVKLNDTSVVTDSTGLALPTTEKNPNIDGTLANQISQLNTNLPNLFSNPNLLINPDFKINQRGFSVYTSGYTVDRWVFSQNINLSSSASVIEEGIIIDTHDSTDTQYRQITDKKYFYKETYITASLKFSDCISLQNTHLVIYVDGLWKANMGFYENHNNIVTCGFLVPSGEHSIGMGVYFDAVNIGTIINWAKLEYGNIATPFVPPDESTELIKCQRYYETNKETGLLTLKKDMLLHVFFKTSKRSIPNVTISPNNSNLKLGYIGKDGFQIQYTGEGAIDFIFVADSEI